MLRVLRLGAGLGVPTSGFAVAVGIVAAYFFGYFEPLWFDRAMLTFVLKPLLQCAIDFHVNITYAVELLVRLVLRIQGKGSVSDEDFESTSFGDAYDFIVVGGGISGCTIASRLAVNHSVLLIHGPGGAASALTRIAFLALFNLNYPKRDFAYKSEPVESRYWQQSRYTYSVGKDFGGTQALSGGVWSYGKPGDFRPWQKLGINAINFDIVRKYGKRHERITRDFPNVGNYRYGEQGEVILTPAFIPDYFQEYLDAFLDGGAEATSTEKINDLNDGPLGFSKPIFAVQRNGFVSSGPRSYFENRKFSNLDIALHSTVLKIVLEKRDSRIVATGVRWTRKSIVRTTNARRKIIVSGGSIRTPQLLMVSGIGNRTLLESIGVETVVNRPGVGENFFDHSLIGNSYVCFPQKSYIDFSTSSFYDFVRHPEKQSSWTTPANTVGVGFFNSKLRNLSTCPDPSNTASCLPDYELLLATFAENTQVLNYEFAKAGFPAEVYADDFYMTNKEDQRNFFPTLSLVSSQWNKLYNQAECLMLLPIMLHPEARGRLTVKSDDMRKRPVIKYDPQSSPRDRALMTALHEQVQDIVKAAFGNTQFNGKFNDAIYKECVNLVETDFSECMVRKYWKGAYHQAGTARMGRRDDPMAVVDEDFNVIGVSGLAVVDASVLPAPTSGHILAVISALAEILAEKLDKATKLPKSPKSHKSPRSPHSSKSSVGRK